MYYIEDALKELEELRKRSLNDLSFYINMHVGGACLINGKGNDIDIFVKNFNGAVQYFESLGYTVDNEGYQNDPDDVYGFTSLRKGDINVIICGINRYRAAERVMLFIKTCPFAVPDNIDKEQRVTLYEVFRGGHDVFW